MRANKLKTKLRTKAPTGIAGFDEITGGGLPRGRTTLLVGGPGSGKTVLALQFPAHGRRGPPLSWNISAENLCIALPVLPYLYLDALLAVAPEGVTALHQRQSCP